MDSYEHLTQYSTLLGIRQKGRRRDVRISGGAFLIAFMITIGSGLLNPEPDRSFYLLLGLSTALGLGFLVSWTRLEIINNTLELIGYLVRDLGEA
jgi:hypothetical protein